MFAQPVLVPRKDISFLCILLVDSLQGIGSLSACGEG
ncbi:MAG: hypothetical protein JWN14_1016, partial [Chthonomonadales bacterium]|nr:hypothetical protein [Chthonomonadales bacterium]